MSKVLVSLVAWNGEKYLRQCLESLLKQSFRDFDLVFFDNGSSDGTVNIANDFQSKFEGRMEIMTVPENIGFAPGHNRVISSKRNSEYVFLVNQDMIFDPLYIEECIKLLDSNDGVGAVSGKLYRWDFENDDKTDRIDTLGLKIYRSFKVIDAEVGVQDTGQFNDDIEVQGVSGAAPIYRLEALEKIKYEDQYFDEDFFSYKEDVDLSLRLSRAGYKIMIAVKAKAWHDRSAKSLENVKLSEELSNRRSKRALINYHSYKNHLFLLVKNLSLRNLIINSPFIIWYEAKKLGYILFFERESLKSLKEFKRLLPKMLEKRKYILK